MSDARIPGPGLAGSGETGAGETGLGGRVSVNDDGCDSDDLAFCGGVLVTVGADESWDEFVALAVERQWVGVEALSGIDGSVGEAVSRNVTAFGQQAGDTVASVRTWDRLEDAQRTFAMVDCDFGPAASRFGREHLRDNTPRYTLLSVSFLMRQGDLTTPMRDDRFARAVGVAVGQRVPLTLARTHALRLAASR